MKYRKTQKKPHRKSIRRRTHRRPGGAFYECQADLEQFTRLRNGLEYQNIYSMRDYISELRALYYEVQSKGCRSLLKDILEFTNGPVKIKADLLRRVLFETRAHNLAGRIQFILASIDPLLEEDPNLNSDFFIREIRAFEAEANAIDAYFGNNEMKDMLNWGLQVIRTAFNLNNDRQTIVSNINSNSSNINNNRGSVISVYNKNDKN